MEKWYLKATRELDQKEIYINADLSLRDWGTVVDTLIDAKFILTPIDSNQYSTAIEEKKYCYIVDGVLLHTFIEFINDHYSKLLDLLKNIDLERMAYNEKVRQK